MVRLRESLRPYIAATRAQYDTQGLPMMRPLALSFPDDATCVNMTLTDTQFMFGDRYLVAPIVTNCTATTSCLWREVYLPVLPSSGTWVHHFTNESFKGGQTLNVSGPIQHFPLFRRVDSTIHA